MKQRTILKDSVGAQTPPRRRIPTSVRLSPEATYLREQLSIVLGVDMTAVLELSLREMAQRHGIAPMPKTK